MHCSKSLTVKIILSVIGALLIPVIMVQRGYFAIGGEIFLPVFPLIIWDLVFGLKEILKGGENE